VVARERDPVEQLSGKPLEPGLPLPEGWDYWPAGGCGCLAPVWCLSQRGGAPVIPHGARALQGLMGGSRRSWGPVVQRIAGAQQGMKGGGLGGQVSQQAVEPAPGWGPVQTGGGDSGGHGSGGTAEGRVSRHGVGPGAGGRRG
jgi:hypothetical protein